MKELLKKKGFLFDVEGVLTDNIDEGHGLSNTANFISLLKKHVTASKSCIFFNLFSGSI